jgi:REP element-mobilizing transposase RayT
MPNHVHLLITPQIDVSSLLRKLKGATARQANKLLMQTGENFWQDESYDHLVRSAEEFRRIANYIIQNPVRAELAASAADYPWSSISGKWGRL